MANHANGSRKWLSILAALVIAGVLPACSSDEAPKSDAPEATPSVDAKPAIDALHASYEGTGAYDVDPEVTTIQPDESIVVDGVKSSGGWQVSQFDDFETPQVNGEDVMGHQPVRLYRDLGLRQDLTDFVETERNDAGGTIVFKPQNAMGIQAGGSGPQAFSSPPENLPNLIEEDSWGVLNELHVVIYNDLETGKLLERPKLKTYKVNRESDEIAAPQVRYSIDEAGALNLAWDPVDGADRYMLVTLNYTSEPGPDGIVLNTGYTLAIADVRGTEFTSIPADETNPVTINNDFRSSVESENELYRKAIEQVQALEDLDDGAQAAVDITVIASDGVNNSAMSNLVNYDDYGSALPYSRAYFTEEQTAKVPQDPSYPGWYDAIEDLPRTVPITMVDGTTRFVSVNYEPDGVEALSDEGSIRVPYTLGGTPFEGAFNIKDDNDYAARLTAVIDDVERGNASGIMNQSFSLEEVAEAQLASQEISTVRPEVPDPVFATTALGEFLAANLIAGSEWIDLSNFPEADSPEYLRGAVFEAIYQNPTIMPIDRYQYVDGRKLLGVTYRYDADERAKRQEEIRASLDAALESVVTDGMSDLEKANAINTYIVDNSEYDWVALNAVYNQDVRVPDMYLDSFSTYGIAVNGTGVCGSYANTFDYMAAKAGLESVVVIGNINGAPEEGHAWNAVQIEGEWRYFDATWNDTGGEPAKFANLEASDPLIADSHVTRNNYIHPLNIGQYK